MKKYGKVIRYNGLSGMIKGIDGKDYLLLDKNVLNSEINMLDNVEFESENFKSPEVEVEVATFVKVLRKENKYKM